ncbi:LCP family protein [Actinokineospora sp. NBRC 105648]|uniref:LCP family protein n=1 Tax=Actinokineospora sp. NBRC 105648 TaxID=3032206 RepID=UPI0024A3D01B|nr:LCP family protein [Actinokineospora sp. NBRC 105648]GLZ41880.1 LytTR family transcriptional regulator [Actinokineospora sp. NBRC 105648]
MSADLGCGLGGFDWSAPPPGKRGRPITLLGKVIVLLVALFVFACVGFGWLLRTAVEENITTLPDVFGELPSRPAATGGTGVTTALLIGTDRRSGPDIGGGVLGERADSLMLVRIAGGRRVDVLALPRDSWVPIPGHRPAKINAALALGGPPLVVRTVEDLTGLRVDHVVVADFAAVRDITGLLGGVTVFNPVATVDPLTHTEFPAGDILVEGDRALTWVRQRYGLPGGDLDRIARQQRLLGAIGTRLTTARVLTHPGELADVVTAVSRDLTVDSGLTAARMAELLAALGATPHEAIHFYTAPVSGTGRSADGQAYLTLDGPALARACAAIGTEQAVELTQEPVLGG